MRTLILPIAPPGAGKTYFCKHVLAPLGIKYFSSDDIREELYGDARIQGNYNETFNILYDRCYEELRKSGVVCVDATNASRYARSQAVLNTCADRVIYIIMDCDVERAKRQNASRKRVCPERVINKMARQLEKEPPHEDDFCTPEIYNYDSAELMDVLKELANG